MSSCPVSQLRPVKILVRTGGLGILQFCTVYAQMCSSQTCKGCFTMFKINSAIFMKPLHPSAHLKLMKMSSKIITNEKASGNQSENTVVGALIMEKLPSFLSIVVYLIFRTLSIAYMPCSCCRLLSGGQRVREDSE